MSPQQKQQYQKLAREIMEPVLTVAARRLEQAVEEIYRSEIRQLRAEIRRLKDR
jgi:sensor histidine kinase YesM